MVMVVLLVEVVVGVRQGRLSPWYHLLAMLHLGGKDKVMETILGQLRVLHLRHDFHSGHLFVAIVERFVGGSVAERIALIIIEESEVTFREIDVSCRGKEVVL